MYHFRIHAKLSVRSHDSHQILKPAFVHMYTNTLTDDFLGLGTRRLYRGTQSEADFILQAKLKYEDVLSQLACIHHINTHTYPGDWGVWHELLEFDIFRA